MQPTSAAIVALTGFAASHGVGRACAAAISARISAGVIGAAR